jgi:hypothetical protein
MSALKSAVACAVLAVGAASTASYAQPGTTEEYNSFDAVAGTPVQVGYFASARKDCTALAVPTIRVIQSPKLGTLIVREAELKVNSIPSCPGLTVPAKVLAYAARARSTDTDNLTYEVTTASGAVAVYHVTISIKEAPRGAPEQLPQK